MKNEKGAAEVCLGAYSPVSGMRGKPESVNNAKVREVVWRRHRSRHFLLGGLGCVEPERKLAHYGRSSAVLAFRTVNETLTARGFEKI